MPAPERRREFEPSSKRREKDQHPGHPLRPDPCPMLGCEEREIGLGKLPRALLGKLMPARQDETAHIERSPPGAA